MDGRHQSYLWFFEVVKIMYFDRLFSRFLFWCLFYVLTNCHHDCFVSRAIVLNYFCCNQMNLSTAVPTRTNDVLYSFFIFAFSFKYIIIHLCLHYVKNVFGDQGGKSPILPPAELGKMGFDIVMYPMSLLSVAIKATNLALAKLKAGEPVDDDLLVDFQELMGVVGFSEYDAAAEKYQPQEKQLERGGAGAGGDRRPVAATRKEAAREEEGENAIVSARAPVPASVRHSK